MKLRIPASIGLLLALAPASLSGQEPPMPDHPTLREGFLAWDRGDYPAALRAYLEALDAPGGDAHVREVALLTGELYQVIEVERDGRSVRVDVTDNQETVGDLIDIINIRGADIGVSAALNSHRVDVSAISHQRRAQFVGGMKESYPGDALQFLNLAHLGRLHFYFKSKVRNVV